MDIITSRLPGLNLEHPGAQLQPGEKNLRERAKDALRNLYARPTTGRNTTQGRKAEKPLKETGGPSGQTDSSWHDSQHTNK